MKHFLTLAIVFNLLLPMFFTDYIYAQEWCDNTICKAPSCNSPCSSCSWCQQQVDIPGVHNPAISTLFGTGAGESIIAILIANVLKITFSIAGLVLLAMLITGGIQWLGSGGDKDAVGKAQKRITSALIGFVIYMAVFAIINYIAPALGIDFLNVLKIEWPTP